MEAVVTSVRRNDDVVSSGLNGYAAPVGACTEPAKAGLGAHTGADARPQSPTAR